MSALRRDRGEVSVVGSEPGYLVGSRAQERGVLRRFGVAIVNGGIRCAIPPYGLTVVRKFAKIVLASVSAAAGLAAVIDFYFATRSLPIVDGISIDACEENLDSETVMRFFEQLGRYNNQYVFVRNLRITGLSFCRNKNTPLNRKWRGDDNAQSFVHVPYSIKLDRQTGDADIEFHKADGNYVIYKLRIHKTKNYPLATNTCDVNCDFGANGAYQVRANFSEDYGDFDLAIAPVVSRIVDAYECTIKKIDLTDPRSDSTWWDRVWGCR